MLFSIKLSAVFFLCAFSLPSFLLILSRTIRPNTTWRRTRGRPCQSWIQQIGDGTPYSIRAEWSRARDRGHGGSSQRTTTVYALRWWWFCYVLTHGLTICGYDSMLCPVSSCGLEPCVKMSVIDRVLVVSWAVRDWQSIGSSVGRLRLRVGCADAIDVATHTDPAAHLLPASTDRLPTERCQVCTAMSWFYGRI